MNRSAFFRSPALPVTAIVLGLVVLFALVAGGAFGRSPDGTPKPSPSAPPSAQPTPKPTPTPTPNPTTDPTPGGTKVPLDIADDHDVLVVIDDKTGDVTDVKSGHAGDGMSVRWHDSKVENLGSNTLRLTWVGLPFDDEVKLSVTKAGNGYAVAMVQKGPLPNTDALGYDRVLVLTFDADVSSDDVTVTITNS